MKTNKRMKRNNQKKTNWKVERIVGILWSLFTIYSMYHHIELNGFYQELLLEPITYSLMGVAICYTVKYIRLFGLDLDI